MKNLRTYNRITRSLLTCALALILTFSLSAGLCFAADTGLPEGYEADEDLNRDLNLNKYGVPVHQFKNVFETETVAVPDIDVVLEDDYYEPELVDESVPFRIYNCTTQETEKVVYTEGGRLKGLQLKRGHAYLITSADEHYIISHYQDVGIPMNRVYVWALAKGDQNVPSDGAYDYKTGYTGDNDADYLRNLREITVHYSDSGFYEPLKYTMRMPVMAGENPVSGVRFTFTSTENEPVTAVSKDGVVEAELIEDTDYTVHVEDDTYDIETFTVTVKDKSEHKYTDEATGTKGYNGRYCYDHTCCQGCNEFSLISKAEKEETVKGSVRSLRTYKSADGTDKSLAEVSGMNFKNLLLLVRSPELELPAELEGSECQTAELTLVNPHRWEKCKVTDTELKTALHLEKDKAVEKVYQLADGSLSELPFTQTESDTVEYTVNSMSVYPVVIKYSDQPFEPETPDVPDNPDNPYNPDKPDVPDNPDNPDDPDNPDQPDNPDNPDQPDVPDNPGTPDQPDNPDTPGQIEQPDKPAKVTRPAATKLLKVVRGKKIIKVTWKKQSRGTTGYQLQYSTSKNFKKGTKTVTIKGAKKTKYTIKKLKSKKKYYVRIRTYRKSGRSKICSKWSAVKSVRVR